MVWFRLLRQHRRNLRVSLLAAAFCAFFIPANTAALAATYYVAPNGSDANDGNAGQPWRTIQKAANTAAAGDHVLIRAGTYNERVKLTRGGTASARITYENFAGEKVILDGTAIPMGSTDALLQIDNNSFVTVKGLIVQNSSHNGVRATSGTNIVLENLTVLDAGENGIAFYNNSLPSKSVVRNCVVHDVHNAGIVLWQNTGGYYLIEGNLVYNVKGANNWDGIQAGDTPFVIIKNNTVYAVGQDGDYIDVGGDQTTTVSRAHHIVIDGNTVYRGTGGTGWVKVNNRPRRAILRRNTIHGTGMSFYEQPHANVAIYHNTIVEAHAHAIQLWNKNSAVPFGGIKIKNNILAFSNTGTLVQHSPLRQDGSTANILFDGNLFRFTSRYGIEWAMADANKDYGTSPTEYKKWLIETGQEPTNGGVYTGATLTELFVDPAKRNFSPARTSPAIDTGVALTRTVGAGSGTRVPVKESVYFCDGYGLTQGDLVKIGSNPPVRVVAVDEAAEALVVDSAIAWKADDSVSLPYEGSGPDIGASESPAGIAAATATRLSPPQNLKAAVKP